MVWQMGRRPSFALVAVLTLPVGIGANTAIFGAAVHVLLRAPPYANTDRSVRLFETDRRTGETARKPRRAILCPGASEAPGSTR